MSLTEKHIEHANYDPGLYYLDEFYQIINMGMTIDIRANTTSSDLERLSKQRLRQIRKRNDKCILDENEFSEFFPNSGRECSNVFDNGNSKSNYGLETEGFEYSTTAGESIIGDLGIYGKGGFRFDFQYDPADTSNIDQAIDHLKSNKWIDEQTLAVIIESNYLYKPSGTF
jgi:hypothetical protein